MNQLVCEFILNTYVSFKRLFQYFFMLDLISPILPDSHFIHVVALASDNSIYIYIYRNVCVYLCEHGFVCCICIYVDVIKSLSVRPFYIALSFLISTDCSQHLSFCLRSFLDADIVVIDAMVGI